jgi:hypothetical protein
VGCAIAFDLGAGRVVSFVSEDTDNATQASTAAHGLTFKTISIQPDWVDTTAAARFIAGTTSYIPSPAGSPNACQGDDGVVRASGCPPHSPNVEPTVFIAQRDRIDKQRVREVEALGPTWWLGLTFRGFGAAGYSPFPVNRNVRELTYQVAIGPQAWTVSIVTIDGYRTAPPTCKSLPWDVRGPFCWRTRLEGRLIDLVNPDAGHTIAVYTTSSDVGNQGQPMPPDVVAQVRTALRPVQLG